MLTHQIESFAHILYVKRRQRAVNSQGNAHRPMDSRTPQVSFLKGDGQNLTGSHPDPSGPKQISRYGQALEARATLAN